MDKKHILLGTGLAAAGAAALGYAEYAMTRQLASVAFDRECPVKVSPAARMRLTGSGDNEQFMEVLEHAARKLEAAPSVTVTVTAEDGAVLTGHWIPHRNAKRILIAMHGWRSRWSRDFGLVSDFFQKNGCSVLYPEQRAQGNSGGEYMGLGMLERFDCLEWIRWVNRTQGKKLPVYLGGISMGASTVLMTAGFDLPENVRGIIADCGFTSPDAISRHIVKNNLHLSYGLRGWTADLLCRRKIRLGTKGYSTLDALKGNRIPVLLIHGAEDSFVPVSMSYENFHACAGPKELLVVPGADHGMSYFVDPDRYEKTILIFWEKYDL